MSESAGPSRPVAITLAVITGLAFVGILVGLALGMLAVAGICGMVLVLMWFVLMISLHLLIVLIASMQVQVVIH